MNHGTHRIHGSATRGRAALVAAVFALTFSSLAADPTITVFAQQRYPWNGLVDLNFTITGTSGMRYDTSFTAKDMVGNTNITMATVRKSDGSVVNVANEQLLPGNYKWVWDAAADLPKDFQCDRMTVTGTVIEYKQRDKVQLWEGGPYWATTNIGAENPWDYGYYFWWGDTVGYKREGDIWVASDGSASGFLFASKNVPTWGMYDKTLKSEGWITEDYVLALEHDAAHVKWGGMWRIPTGGEVYGLYDNCDWTWTSTNGVMGCLVRGRGDYATASIFLPCTGFASDDRLVNDGILGDFSSSSPESGQYSNGCKCFHGGFCYTSSLGLYFSYGWTDRFYGVAVRPVQGSAE